MASDVSSKQNYVIIEGHSFLSVHSPLKSTQRIKYTCFDVSSNFLIFGATSGGLYVFDREPCNFLQLFPHKEGHINNVAISPDEKLIAFSTIRGIACVLEYDEDGTKVVNRSLEHCGSHITALTWADASSQLFVADDRGRLSVINLSLFMSKNIFQLPAYVFMKLDSGVVQVCCKGDNLLVSTQTRCYICDTIKEQYKQIGNKLREGDYGTCFLCPSIDNNKIFCARPGSRLWEVDVNGAVISTHQFKQALAMKPVPILLLETEELIISSESDWPEQSLNFTYLTSVMNKYILGFSRDGLYIFDPEKVDVVLWTNYYQDIYHVKCINDTIYLWTSKRELHALLLSPLVHCLLKLYFGENYELCFQLCERYSDAIRNPDELKKLTPLLGLREHLSDFKFSDKLHEFFKLLSVHNSETQFSTELDSGIFLVENRHLKWKIPEEDSFVVNSEESRSHSLPPETSCVPVDHKVSSTKYNEFCSTSTNSLPDLSSFSNQTDKPTIESVTADESILNGHHSSYIVGTYCEEYLIPQIPFISFTSPDIINNAIIELGHNVSGKLYSSTRSLIDKWQVLEGKFKFLKANISHEQIEMSKTSSHKSFITYDDVNDDIVSRKKRGGTKSISSPSINISKLLDICSDFEKLENGKKFDMIYHLFEFVIKANDDYYKSLVTEAKNIVKKVFPFGQYLNGKQVLVIQQIFHEALKSGKIVKYLQRLQGEQLLPACDLKHHQLLRNIYSQCELMLDCTLSCIISIFSELLDPFTILNCLEETKIPCTFMSWCVILETFQESAFNYITGGNNSCVGYADWPLPLLLNTMFLMFKLDQVESSCHMAIDGFVKLYNVSYLLLKLTAHLESTGLSPTESFEHCNKLYLNFILKLSTKCPVNEKDLKDKLILNHLEKSLLESNNVDITVCKCGYACLGMLTTVSKYKILGELLLNHYWSTLSNDVKTSTEDTYDFRGLNLKRDNFSLHLPGNLNLDSKMKQILVKLLRHYPELIVNIMEKDSDNIESWLPFIVQFGQLSYVGKFFHNCTPEFWENVCDLSAKLSSGNCCICLNKLSTSVEVDWDQLSQMVLKALGPMQALNLLIKYASQIPRGQLNIRFHRACLLSGLIESQTSEFKPSLVDAYYKAVSRQPLQKDNAEDSSVMTWEADSTDSHMPDIVYSKDRKNWGITIDLDLDACARCSLTLNAEKLIRDGGLRAFKCSHVYHVVCLRLCQSPFNCPLCR